MHTSSAFELGESFTYHVMIARYILKNDRTDVCSSISLSLLVVCLCSLLMDWFFTVQLFPSQKVL